MAGARVIFVATVYAACFSALALPDARPDLRSTLDLVQRGHCDQAMPALAALLAADPRLVPAYNAVGICEAHRGRTAQAIQALETVVKLEPGAWQGWNNLGKACAGAGNQIRAAEAFRKAAALHPAAPELWFQLGRELMQLDRPEEAFAALDRAQRLRPATEDIGDLWLRAASRLGTEAARQVDAGQYTAASKLLERIRRPLEHTASWNNLYGYVEFKLGRPRAALPALQKALAMEPDNQDYLFDVGEFLAYYHASQRAVELFRVAVRRMPDSPRVRFGLAVAYILENRRADAVGILKALVQAHPDFEPAYRALGECYEDAGDEGPLLGLGRQLQSVNRRNPFGWYMEGAGELRDAEQGQASPAPAIAALKRAIELQPRVSRFHFVLAKAYQAAGDPDSAIRELRETLRLEPNHERAHYVLARLLLQKGLTAQGRLELAAHSRLKARDRSADYRVLLIQSRPE